MSFTDTIGTLHSNQAYCGAKSYTWTPALSFLSLNASTLSLQTNSIADAGSQVVILSIGLASYPDFSPLTIPFTVEVTACEVLSLTFRTSPPSTITIQIGIDS